GTVLIPGTMALGSPPADWPGISVANRDNLTLLGTSYNAGFRIRVQPTLTVPPVTFWPMATAFLFTQCSRLTLRGLYFESTISDGGSGFVALSQCSNCVIESNHFYNTGLMKGGTTEGQVCAVVTNRGINNTIKNNLMDHCATAIAL